MGGRGVLVAQKDRGESEVGSAPLLLPHHLLSSHMVLSFLAAIVHRPSLMEDKSQLTGLSPITHVPASERTPLDSPSQQPESH